MTKQEIIPIELDGKKYYTVAQFAVMTNRSEVNVRHLIYQGNTQRQIKK